MLGPLGVGEPPSPDEEEDPDDPDDEFDPDELDPSLSPSPSPSPLPPSRPSKDGKRQPATISPAPINTPASREGFIINTLIVAPSVPKNASQSASCDELLRAAIEPITPNVPNARSKSPLHRLLERERPPANPNLCRQRARLDALHVERWRRNGRLPHRPRTRLPRLRPHHADHEPRNNQSPQASDVSASAAVATGRALLMDRSVFKQHFIQAAESARDFARTFLEEPLPDAMRFRVHLNQSYDAHASPDVRLFPEDSAEERRLAVRDVEADDVIDLLWRDGHVPEWIDVMVVAEMGDATILDVNACGRFNKDDKALYYTSTDVPPFGPKGPWLPAHWVEGQRFTIYERPSCWTVAHLDRVRKSASKVRRLKLHGAAFTDDVLTTGSGLRFPNVVALDLDGVAISGRGLAGLANDALPQLAYLRIYARNVSSLSFAELPVLREVEELTLEHLPRDLKAVSRLNEALANVMKLTLDSDEDSIQADAELAFRYLTELTLRGRMIGSSWLSIPRLLGSMNVYAAKATDDDVLQLLARCPKGLESLSLRGTPVTERILDAVGERFPTLKDLDVVDTRISEEAVHAFAKGRSGLRVLPQRLSSECDD
jgi:hypothetical protein